jgi:hypothetical protein
MHCRRLPICRTRQNIALGATSNGRSIRYTTRLAKPSPIVELTSLIYVGIHRTLPVAGQVGQRGVRSRNSPALRSRCDGQVAVKAEVTETVYGLPETV